MTEEVKDEQKEQVVLDSKKKTISYISIDDFDWKYYLNKNNDLFKCGIRAKSDLYRHWINCGCYENRLVRRVSSGEELRVGLDREEKMIQSKEEIDRIIMENEKMIHLKKKGVTITLPMSPSIKTLIDYNTNTKRSTSMKVEHQNKKIPSIRLMQKQPVIKLNFKMAIMIHIFDIELCSFYINYLNKISNKYCQDDIDIYINFVLEENPFSKDENIVKEAIDKHIQNISNSNMYYCFSENRGGDIGGLYVLSKIVNEKVINEKVDYKYVIFAHTKKNAEWRKDLVKAIFNYRFENLPKKTNLGILGCKQWIYTIEPRVKSSTNELNRYKYHLDDLCKMYDVEEEVKSSWRFIAGTMFIADIRVIQYLVKDENVSGAVYYRLNKLSTLDVNWHNIVVNELKLDPLGAGNDLAYRMRYGKPLHPDYMIEHTIERLIGLICKKLKLSVIGET